MATISLKNVCKIYPGEKGGDVTAVNDVSLDIADREFIVLTGPAGCGKSAILRMIAGLEEISKGDIFIGEKRINDLAPKDRDVAMVFYDYALYPHFNVFDNLAFGLRLRKYGEAEIRKRVVEAAGILGIESLLERKLKALSSAEQQRVAVGRAITRQPKVLLLDDPLSRLDAAIRPQMRTEMIKLHQRLEATVIYATADQIDAMAMGDRIAVMNNGVIQQNDAPRALYDEPLNFFVAGYFGTPTMNFVRGTLKEEGQRIRFRESEGGTIDVAFEAAARPAARGFFGKEVVLGIRPEDLKATPFSRKEAKTAPIGFPAIVDAIEPMGAEANLYLQTGAHILVCRSRDALDRHDAGHRFWFEMKMEKAHLFDPVSTDRVG